MVKKKFPVGIDIFEKVIKQNFYYVDKTGLISELLHNWGEVNLFTRPRRFGKTLNMSMLQSFFEIGSDSSLFNGLKIADEKELCAEYMGQFPVISISLKGMEGLTYSDAVMALKSIIGWEAMRFPFLAESNKLSDSERKMYKALIEVKQGQFTMPDTLVPMSLKILSALLARYYGKQVVLLIDEYDVPLDKAFQQGYYDKMISLIRGLFGNVLKTNPDLYFAVLTGCLRVSKESIFTGLNNMKVLSVTNVQFDEYFGFTDKEVQELLQYYELMDYYNVIKEWYDGYQFGKVAVYCPWDVISYCDNLAVDSSVLPEDYWSNTSSNSIIRMFISKADKRTRDEIESLIEGKTIIKEIKQELTYNELDKRIDNLWSVLFTTGYLTQYGKEGRKYQLAIPNLEIRELFVTQIREWFSEVSKQDTSKLDKLCEAFSRKDAETIENLFNEYLWNTISIRDNAVAKEKKENFYHGILLGLLGYKENWYIKSNAESGEGYSDILIEIPETRTGIVIEMKYAENGQFDVACKGALKQIEEKKYETKLKEDGMKEIVKYGIACYKKSCSVCRASSSLLISPPSLPKDY